MNEPGIFTPVISHTFISHHDSSLLHL